MVQIIKVRLIGSGGSGNQGQISVILVQLYKTGGAYEALELISVPLQVRKYIMTPFNYST